MFMKDREMKRISTLLLAAVFLLLPVSDTSARKAVRSVSKHSVTKAGAVKLKLSPLPKKNGKIDARQVLIESAGVKQNFARQLMRSQQKELSVIIKSLRNNQVESAQQDFHKFLEHLNSQEVPMDINELISHILRESYLVMNKELEFYAAKVKHFNDLKEKIRKQVNEARKLKASLNNCCSKAEKIFDNYIKEMEEELNSVGDDAQLANIDLQNNLQKQQQTIQMLSNISKVLHDTAMAVIRKIG